jgi:hypothetical protein
MMIMRRKCGSNIRLPQGICSKIKMGTNGRRFRVRALANEPADDETFFLYVAGLGSAQEGGRHKSIRKKPSKNEGIFGKKILKKN